MDTWLCYGELTLGLESSPQNYSIFWANDCDDVETHMQKVNIGIGAHSRRHSFPSSERVHIQVHIAHVHALTHAGTTAIDFV